MGLPYLGLGLWGIRWVIPCQESINSPPDQFRYCQPFTFSAFLQARNLRFSEIEIGSSHGFSFLTYNIHCCIISIAEKREKGKV
jgi:hypothetical protein